MERELQAQGQEQEQERQHAATKQVSSPGPALTLRSPRTHTLFCPSVAVTLHLLRVTDTFEINKSSSLSRKRGVLIYPYTHCMQFQSSQTSREAAPALSCFPAEPYARALRPRPVRIRLADGVGQLVSTSAGKQGCDLSSIFRRQSVCSVRYAESPSCMILPH